VPATKRKASKEACQIIGDLSNAERVLVGLQLRER
jgi:hypothetical protein